ncbi:hypothetical protein MXB_1255 [Myxobolus squamalis]|nr:hypothetical protein MXB_1255 [Myxobolus squamalis]
MSRKSGDKIGKTRQSESVPTTSDYFTNLKNTNEKNINWSFVSHVLRECDPHASLTSKTFRKAYHSKEAISCVSFLPKLSQSPSAQSQYFILLLSTEKEFQIKSLLSLTPTFINQKLVQPRINNGLIQELILHQIY